MVGPLGAQADAGSVSQPEPTSFGLSGRNLQPLAWPDPLDPLVIDRPACRRAQQRGDLAIAVAAIAADQFDEVASRSFGSAISCPSSSRPCGIRRWVERCCPNTPQTRRSDTFRASRTWSMQARRRAGLPVSRSRLLQDQLVERQVGDGATEPGVLSLKLLHPLHLIRLQAAELTTPAE